MKEKIYLGIDFGTTNIKVSIWNINKKEARKYKLGTTHGQGDSLVKNAIYYGENQEIVLGEKAIAHLDTKNLVADIKSKMTLESWEKYIENVGEKKTIKDIIKDILLKIKMDIESKEGNKSITDTIITTPVNFTKVQQQIIKEACKEIGLPVRGFLAESVAGAIGLDLDDEVDVEDKILVFDFGGGTLDLTKFDNIVEEKKEINNLNI